MMMALGNLLLVALLQILGIGGHPELAQGSYGAVVNQTLDLASDRSQDGTLGIQTTSDDGGVSAAPGGAAASLGSVPSGAIVSSNHGERVLSPQLQKRLSSLSWITFAGLLMGILLGTALGQWRLRTKGTEQAFQTTLISYILLPLIVILPTVVASSQETYFLTCGIAIIGWSNMHSRMMGLKTLPHIVANIVMLAGFLACLYILYGVFKDTLGLGSSPDSDNRLVEEKFNLLFPVGGAAMFQLAVVYACRTIYFKNENVIDQLTTWSLEPEVQREKSDYFGGKSD